MIKNIVNGIKEVVVEISTGILDVLKMAYATVTNIFYGIVNAIKEVVVEVSTGIVDILKMVYNTIYDIFYGIVNGIKDVVVDVSTGLAESCKSVYDESCKISTNIEVKLMGSYKEMEAYEKAKESKQ